MIKNQSSRDKRKASPNPMRFQSRDGEIIQAIYKYDGVLSRRQIKQLFWPSASVKTMERRLTLLYHNGFLNIPNADQRRINPIPEPVVWLGWRGILYMVHEMDLEVEALSKINENQLRKLEKSLRSIDLRWQREPRWSQLGHDIAVNDFRLAVEKAVHYWPSLSLEKWIPEGKFFTNMDTVTVGKRKKGVRPDGFFVLVDHMRQINNSPAKARFLLELDNSTHPVTRFGRDKAIPGLAYIRSKAYKDRFGYNSGRWLVVCRSEQRLQNLKAQTEKVLGKPASNFLFTTLDQASPMHVLNRPIWLRGGSENLIPLINNIGAE